MKATISARPLSHQRVWATAMAKGLERHGVQAQMVEDPCQVRGCDFAVCWGWRIGERLRQQGHEVLVLERGYVGDRFTWTSVAWNGLNGRGDFCLPETVDGRRAERHFGHLMKPWRHDGRVVAIMGQVQGDASLQGQNMTAWYRETAAGSARAYGLPVVFRPHPVADRRRLATPAGLMVERGPLEALFERALAVVTYNSNSAVDAILAGVPAVATDAGSMALPVAGRAIGERPTPERAEWLARLAWCQWRVEELADGSAWDRMKVGCREIA